MMLTYFNVTMLGLLIEILSDNFDFGPYSFSVFFKKKLVTSRTPCTLPRWVFYDFEVRSERCTCVNNWSRLHTKFVFLCPDFTNDSEAFMNKWSVIYNDYKDDKSMNMRSGSERSEKWCWYQLVDGFISDRTHVVSYAHASVTNPDGPKNASTSDTNTTEYKSRESPSKSPELKRKKNIFLKRYIGEIK